MNQQGVFTMKTRTRLVLLLVVGLVGGCNSDPNRNWAGLDANQQEAMRNLSIHFQEQAAKEQAAQNDFFKRTYETQKRQYEDDKIREDVRRCIDNQIAQNPYNTDTSRCR